MRSYLPLVFLALLTTFTGIVKAGDSHEWSITVITEGEAKKGSVQITAGHPKHGDTKYFSDKNGRWENGPDQKTQERSFKAADEVWEFEIQKDNARDTGYTIDVFMDHKPVMHVEWHGKGDAKNKADSNGLVAVTRSSSLNESGETSYKIDAGKKGKAGAIEAEK